MKYSKRVEEIHKELNLDDAEDGDLIHIDDESDEVSSHTNFGMQDSECSGGSQLLLPFCYFDFTSCSIGRRYYW